MKGIEFVREKFKKGDFIGEKYEVLDLLGEGGFGIVYKVLSHEAKKVYAFKTWRDDYIEDTTIRERFQKEAQVWIELDRHPYIVSAYYVISIYNKLYICMEYIASDESNMNTLEGYLRNRPPDMAQSLRWGIQFCFGMEYAHSKSIRAHRDIKPANIMIDQNMVVKITDFGLSGLYISGPQNATETTRNKVNISTGIGTPEYMSPEQFDYLSTCDERSDIYSFGIVLFRMAADNNLPFKVDDSEYRWAALKHYHQDVNIPRLTSPLYPIIFRCLQKNPRNRYQAFKELRADLECLLRQRTGDIVKLPELKKMEAWELYNKGASLANLKNYQDAIDCYDKAIEIDPRYVMAWYGKGNALRSLDKVHQAIGCYNKALEINARYVKAWDAKGFALVLLKKNQDAITCYDKAIEIDPKYSEAWNNKGNALRWLGNAQEAMECYNKALEIDQRNDAAWKNKGDRLYDLHKYPDALVCFNKVIEIDPTSEATWYIKAIVEEKLNMQEAITSWNNFIKYTPIKQLAASARSRIDKLSKQFTQKQ